MSLLSQFFGGASRKIKLNVLVVGGGGGGGGVLSNFLPGGVMPGPAGFGAPSTNAIGGGGGGGGAGVINNYFISPGTVCPITVGGAGAAGVGIGSTTLTTGGNGGTSIFQDPTGETFTLIGGGGGGVAWGNPLTTSYSPLLTNGLPGGSGGGVGASAPGGGVAGANGSYFTSSVHVNIGGPNTPINEGIDIGSGTLYGFPSNPSPSSGGGGAGGASAPGTPLLGMFFAPNILKNGLLNNITGIITSYASGGNGGPSSHAKTPTVPAPGQPPSPVGGTVYTAPVAGALAVAVANSGNGAVAVSNISVISAPDNTYYFSYSGPGLVGAAGVVVVSYPTAFAASPSFPGASDISPQTPGYRTYQFTSPGSITLP